MSYKDRLLSLRYVNKYSLTIAAFIIWMSIFDKYSWIKQQRLSNSMHALEAQKEKYEKDVVDAIKDREELNSNLEKFAREKYYFHKDGEEVIIIKD